MSIFNELIHYWKSQNEVLLVEKVTIQQPEDVQPVEDVQPIQQVEEIQPTTVYIQPEEDFQPEDFSNVRMPAPSKRRGRPKVSVNRAIGLPKKRKNKEDAKTSIYLDPNVFLCLHSARLTSTESTI